MSVDHFTMHGRGLRGRSHARAQGQAGVLVCLSVNLPHWRRRTVLPALLFGWGHLHGVCGSTRAWQGASGGEARTQAQPGQQHAALWAAARDGTRDTPGLGSCMHVCPTPRHAASQQQQQQPCMCAEMGSEWSREGHTGQPYMQHRLQHKQKVIFDERHRQGWGRRRPWPHLLHSQTPRRPWAPPCPAAPAPAGLSCTAAPAAAAAAARLHACRVQWSLPRPPPRAQPAGRGLAGRARHM